MTRSLIAAAVLATLSMSAAQAATEAAPAAAAASTAAKKAPTATQKQIKSNAKAKALATAPAPAPAPALTEGQLAAAKRVFTGVAECEFGEKVSVAPVADRPGEFKVGFKKVSYTMVPEETTTGAVRLVDKTGGGVWLQIPFKSMLLDTKSGHRLVDGCQEPEQRAFVHEQQASAAK